MLASFSKTNQKQIERRLTVDSQTGPGLQLLSLAESSVPDRTAVGGPVPSLVGVDGQHAAALLVPVGPEDHGGLQELRLALSVPFYLGRGRASSARTGQVQRFSCNHLFIFSLETFLCQTFNSNRSNGENSRR